MGFAIWFADYMISVMESERKRVKSDSRTGWRENIKVGLKNRYHKQVNYEKKHVYARLTMKQLRRGIKRCIK